jgi:hypothetical protein
MHFESLFSTHIAAKAPLKKNIPVPSGTHVHTSHGPVTLVTAPCDVRGYAVALETVAPERGPQ